MAFMDAGGTMLYGAINVPNSWQFSDGYGFHLPAGLPAGDYSVFVNCGGGNEIWISQWITGPGTGIQYLDYVGGLLPVVTVPPVVAPAASPSAAPAPISDGSGITVTNGTSGSTRSAEHPTRAARSISRCP